MPQSLTQICLHIVFSTKYRQPLIKDEIKDDLYAYIGGICREIGSIPIQVLLSYIRRINSCLTEIYKWWKYLI